MPENKTCTASFSPRKIAPSSAQFPSQRSASGRCRDVSQCRTAEPVRQNPPPHETRRRLPAVFFLREQTKPHKARQPIARKLAASAQPPAACPHRRTCLESLPSLAAHARVARPPDRQRRESPPRARNGHAPQSRDRARAGSPRELLQRRRRKRRPNDIRRRPLPSDMIGQIARAPGCGATRARDADRPETIHQHARFSRLIVKRDVAFQKIVAELLHPRAHAAGCAG